MLTILSPSPSPLNYFIVTDSYVFLSPLASEAKVWEPEEVTPAQISVLLPT
jgi:hypothetical protein